MVQDFSLDIHGSISDAFTCLNFTVICIFMAINYFCPGCCFFASVGWFVCITRKAVEGTSQQFGDFWVDLT